MEDEAKKQRARDRAKQWYQDHPERVKERSKIHRQKQMKENPESVREYYREYRKKNIKRIREIESLSRKKNIDRIRSAYKTHKTRYADKIIEYRKRPEIKAKKLRATRMERKMYPEKEMARYIKRLYGMTLEDYNKILLFQGGVCKICGLTDESGRRLNVDHCHKTGVVRGLLCRKCNTAIGLFRDDPTIIRMAAQYLESANK